MNQVCIEGDSRLFRSKTPLSPCLLCYRVVGRCQEVVERGKERGSKRSIELIDITQCTNTTRHFTLKTTNHLETRTFRAILCDKQGRQHYVELIP